MVSGDEQQDYWEQRLRPHLTDAWLTTLIEAVRTTNMLCRCELVDFTRWCHQVAGQPMPDLGDPYLLRDLRDD